MITAPGYTFVAVYTIAKWAIAFTVARIFGAILHMQRNYDLYILTLQVRVHNLFRKHRLATLISTVTILLLALSDFYPTLMIKLAPTTSIVQIISNLNLLTNDTQYLVPAYTGIYGIGGKLGIVVDVPRTSNDSLVWAGLSNLQGYYTLLNDSAYRPAEEVHNGSFFMANFQGDITNTNSVSLTALALSYGHLAISTSRLLNWYDTAEATTIGR